LRRLQDRGHVMIQRERIADNVFAFQSEIYAQVTAGR